MKQTCICRCGCNNPAMPKRQWLCQSCDENRAYEKTEFRGTASYHPVHMPRMRAYNKLMREQMK